MGLAAPIASVVGWGAGPRGRGLLAAGAAAAGLVACSLASEGTALSPSEPGAQGSGGAANIEAGAGGSGPGVQGGAGSPAGGSGGSGGSGEGGAASGSAGTAGAAGGTGGAAGVGGGGSGGSAGSPPPSLLGCPLWLPGNAAWVVAGDARNEASGIVLTPPDAPARVRWGQARLPMAIDAEDEIEVAFTFSVVPGAGGVDFAEGASFWFGSGANPLQVPRLEGLGVPSAPSGVALGLDLRSTTFETPTPFWGLYGNRANDGLDLSDVVATEATNVFSALGAAPLAGPHVAIVRLQRDRSGSGEDDVAMAVQLGATADAPRLDATFVDGSDETFGAGFLGFGAESREGPGAAHALLGAEVKIDGACLAPP